jgi:beta-ureidopropionase / N-carbamoyl-L-amino-acid hydrolase
MSLPVSFQDMWAQLRPIGRDPHFGGYRRFAFTGADVECRAWFREQSEIRGLSYEVDRNGNQWAWLGNPADGDAVVTGSHLDSVPDGGAFDGPLGVVSAFAALDEVRHRGRDPVKPVAIVNFGDEEGARFGVACAGSRLSAGHLDPERARALLDTGGLSLAHAMERAGYDPEAIGHDDQRLARIGAFVELHVEQGRFLADTPCPVGVASMIWPHGRWRFDFRGEANHAGTTAIADRRDPMPTYAATVLAARERARQGAARATFGRVAIEPNGTNAIASSVQAWLDARAPDEATLAEMVGAIERDATRRSTDDGVAVEVSRESFTPIIEFAPRLRDTVAGLVKTDQNVPILPTAAGHDAGILSSTVPTAMLFVRNPTGVSHSPAEFAEEDDCVAGVLALADVLEGLACQ